MNKQTIIITAAILIETFFITNGVSASEVLLNSSENNMHDVTKGDPNRIEVTGTGYAEAYPDVCTLNMSINKSYIFFRPSAEEMNKIKQQIKDLPSIKNNNSVTVKGLEVKGLDGYEDDHHFIRKDFSVEIKDISSIENIFKELNGTENVYYDPITCKFNDKTQIQIKASKMAVKNAYITAENIAKTLGRTLGDPLKISIKDHLEKEVQSLPTKIYQVDAEFEKIKYTSNAQITYSLK